MLSENGGHFSVPTTTTKLTGTPTNDDVGDHNISLVLSDGVNEVEHNFTITVNNVNAAPTAIALSGTTVAENSPTGTLIGTLSTTDEDSGDTHTYSLTCNGADNTSFAIEGAALKAAATFDYETKNSYSICIRSTDEGSLHVDQNFTITVTDVSEFTSSSSSTPASSSSSIVSSSSSSTPASSSSAVASSAASSSSSSSSGFSTEVIIDGGSSSSVSVTVSLQGGTQEGATSSGSAYLRVETAPNATNAVEAAASSQGNPIEPQEELVFVTIDSNSGGSDTYSQSVTFTIPEDQNAWFTGFMKYGKELGSSDSEHWFDFGTLAANNAGANAFRVGTGYTIGAGGKTITITLADNQAGDNNPASGIIEDPAALIVSTDPRAAGSVAVPLFGPFGYLLFSALLGLLAARRLRS